MSVYNAAVHCNSLSMMPVYCQHNVGMQNLSNLLTLSANTNWFLISDTACIYVYISMKQLKQANNWLADHQMLWWDRSCPVGTGPLHSLWWQRLCVIDLDWGEASTSCQGNWNQRLHTSTRWCSGPYMTSLCGICCRKRRTANADRWIPSNVVHILQGNSLQSANAFKQSVSISPSIKQS